MAKVIRQKGMSIEHDDTEYALRCESALAQRALVSLSQTYWHGLYDLHNSALRRVVRAPNDQQAGVQVENQRANEIIGESVRDQAIQGTYADALRNGMRRDPRGVSNVHRFRRT